MKEITTDRLESFLHTVSKCYPYSKIDLTIVGLDSYLKQKRGATNMSRDQLDAWLVDVFVKYTGVTHCMVPDFAQAAQHIVHLSNAFQRILYNKYDVSFLSVFGGCKSTEAINIVDLKLHMPRENQDLCPKKLLEWINLLHAIPGIGPKDAHVHTPLSFALSIIQQGIALVYPSFSKLMETYTNASRFVEF